MREAKIFSHPCTILGLVRRLKCLFCKASLKPIWRVKSRHHSFTPQESEIRISSATFP